MSAGDLLREAIEAGIDIRLKDGGITLRSRADDAMLDEWVMRLRPHKVELIERLLESSRAMHELIEAAMRACDHFGDGPAAREQMRRECHETPPELRADLLAHFRRAYPVERREGDA